MITEFGIGLIKQAGLGIGAGLALYSGITGAGAGYGKAKKLDENEADILRDEYGLGAGDTLKARNAARGLVGGIVGSLPGALVASSRFSGPIAKALGVVGALGGGTLGSHIMSEKYSKDGAEFVHDMRNKILPDQIAALDLPLDAKHVLADYYGYDPDKIA